MLNVHKDKNIKPLKVKINIEPDIVRYCRSILGSITSYSWTEVRAKNLKEAKIKAYQQIKEKNKELQARYRMESIKQDTYDPYIYRYTVHVRFSPGIEYWIKNYKL